MCGLLEKLDFDGALRCFPLTHFHVFFAPVFSTFERNLAAFQRRPPSRIVYVPMKPKAVNAKVMTLLIQECLDRFKIQL